VKPFVSTVTGGWISQAEATSSEYWVSQLRSPVLFAAAIETLRASGCATFLEVGPGATLAGFVAADQAVDARPLICGGLPRPAATARSETASLHQAVADLWSHGVELDWPAYHAGERPRRVALPTYPFERLRVWPSLDRRGGSRRGRPDGVAVPDAPPAAAAPARSDDSVDLLRIVEDQILVMQAQLSCWSEA
jgi:acyl transferase domain-containing protein